MKEIVEALSIRIKSPVFGYFILSFSAINWKVLFVLIFENSGVQARIAYFDSNTDFYTLLLFPLAVASFGAVTYPWVNFIFLWLSRKPTELRNSVNIESEHNSILAKSKLEELRNELLTQKEKTIIDQAKRDQEVLSMIKDEESRQNVQDQIIELRSKSSPNESNKFSKVEQTLYNDYINKADELKEAGNERDAERMLLKALELERGKK